MRITKKLNMMKKIKYFWIIPFLFAMLSTSCETEEYENPVFAEDAVPRIFGWSTANVYTTNIEDPLELDLSVSPSDGATYQWFIDGEEVSTEQDFTHTFSEPKNYTLRYEVTRNGVTNSREAQVIVIKPFEPKFYNKRMVGFLTRDGSIEDVDFDNLTHLVISSAVVGRVEGRESLVDTTFTDMDIDLIVKAAHNAGVYVMLDVTDNLVNINGFGLYGEKNFYNLIAEPETRQEVIETVVKFAEDHEMDGINIYLNNYSLGDLNAGVIDAFFRAIPPALPQGPGPDGEFFYSASVPGGWTTGNFSPIATIEELDWVNLQPYRYETLTPSDHSPFWATTALVAQWQGFGLPSEKIVVGIPAFGLKYDMPDDGTEVGWGNLWMYATYHSFREILTLDPQAHTKDMLDIADGIFYDGHPKINQKAHFVLENDLGGLAIWSLESDTQIEEKSLLTEAYSALGN